MSGKEINCLDDLRRLPILSRDEVKRNPSEFFADNYSPSERISLHTTGTSGSPLKIECNKSARQKNYAFFDGYLETIGLNPASRHIIIGGRVIVPPNVKKPPFWRYSYFQKSLLMSSYHLKDIWMDAYIDKIKSFSPEYIESYPSSIYLLAKYILKHNRPLKCKAVVTSAETLSDEQRETIEQAFNTKVYDQYGCAEMCFFVGQCSYGNYHVRPDYGVLELVDDHGNQVEKGRYGKVLCTGFVNSVMPLIRYSIGDIASYSEEESCLCGLDTPILMGIQGRIDDVLLTSDGRPVGRMSPVLKGFPIRESQYIQYKAGEIELLIVPEPEFSRDRDMKQIIESVRLRLGSDCKVSVRMVDSIERGKGGKRKAVISYVNDARIN
jgi:phenylacetate-CoA ligase